MHVPDHFAERRPDELHRIIREHPFGILVTHTRAGLGADHLPFVLDMDRGALGTLVFHVARANPVWKALADGDPALAVFRGAQGYISANWYASRDGNPEQAPTWNYQAVHAHGRVRICDDPREVHAMVERLVDQQKLSQNKDDRDFASAVAALEARGEAALAREMKRLRALGP